MNALSFGRIWSKPCRSQASQQYVSCTKAGANPLDGLLVMLQAPRFDVLFALQQALGAEIHLAGELIACLGASPADVVAEDYVQLAGGKQSPDTSRNCGARHPQARRESVTMDFAGIPLREG